MFEGSNARKIEENCFTQRDRRADGGARHIRVTRSDILISRRFHGVAMKIRVPVSFYRGVALEVRATAGGGVAYLITLAHRDADLDILLAEVKDGAAVATEWKYWANWLGLPRLAIDDDETNETDAGGGVAFAAEPVARRRVATLLKRRPRFLMRRKSGVSARMSEVFADEREIICYE